MQFQQCSACHRVLPLDNFSFDRRVRSGRQKRCRECTVVYLRQYRKAKRDLLAQKDRERSQRPERKRQQAKADARRRQVAAHKINARKRVHRALRKGAITRQACRFCGSVHVQAHHEDYSRPLDVVWVCQQCHRQHFHPAKD